MTTPNSEFRPGQRVRVSFEATVVTTRLGDPNMVHVDNPIFSDGHYAHALHSSQVEVIDDPASDPIGTVRRCGGRPFVKTAGENYPWVQLDACRRATSPMGVAVDSLSGNGNETMRGTEIIGMVPGFEETP